MYGIEYGLVELIYKVAKCLFIYKLIQCKLKLILIIIINNNKFIWFCEYQCNEFLLKIEIEYFLPFYFTEVKFILK